MQFRLAILVISFIASSFALPEGYSYESPKEDYNPDQGYNYDPPKDKYLPPKDSYLPPKDGYLPPQDDLRPTSEVTKDIFVHVAPDASEQHPSENHGYLPRRKHYRIVFIKAPSHPQKPPPTPPPAEEKTIIYVLSKKPDPEELQSLLQQAPIKVNKPEVFFIKYKTKEEAAFAQQEIQKQYDSLGGTTHVSDEGTSPVINAFGGSQSSVNSFQSGNSLTQSSNNFFKSSNSLSNKYLPL